MKPIQSGWRSFTFAEFGTSSVVGLHEAGIHTVDDEGEGILASLTGSGSGEEERQMTDDPAC